MNSVNILLIHNMQSYLTLIKIIIHSLTIIKMNNNNNNNQFHINLPVIGQIKFNITNKKLIELKMYLMECKNTHNTLIIIL